MIAKDDRELAEAMGVSTRTINRWRNRGCPRNEDGSYDVEEVAAWQEDNRMRAPHKPKVDGEISITGAALNEERRWQQMYRKAKAVKETMIVEEMRKKVLPVAEIEQQYILRMAELKQALLSMGKALAPQLEGQDMATIAQRIDDHVFDRLEQFADGMHAISGETQRKVLEWVAHR